MKSFINGILQSVGYCTIVPLDRKSDNTNVVIFCANIELHLMNQKTKKRASKPNKMTDDAIEIRLPADPKLLKIVRVSVANFCEIIGFPSDECNNAMLAVDEACSNIIKHAYHGPTAKPILVTLRRLNDGIEVILRDYGIKADPKTIKPRPLDDVRPGGLGVHLIRSVMDKVEFENRKKEEGNQLTLTKYLPGK